MVADAENGLVLAVEVTPASCSETKMLANLIDKCEVKVGTRVYADKGYSGNPNREALRKRKLKNGIMHRAARGKKLSDRDKMFNQIVSVTRYKIERTFGTIKKHLGQGRARYVGLGNTAFDLRMASIAYNLKRAVNMLPVELAA
jgi:IS5 family transposase